MEGGKAGLDCKEEENETDLSEVGREGGRED
jgi:hypothetical protein